ncbi:MAG: U32 family peptidase [Clostridia bacterium]
MKKLEVLAPAGNFENLEIAINSGANAIYFGVKNFNARAKANNFELNDLKQIVKFAHLHHVKMFMTLNILIKNEEIEDVIKVVDKALECKVDAFIVQDIGLATLLLSAYDNIVLHASTQMGVHNLAGAKILQNLGFKRVILSRETSLEEIKLIKKHTNLEIEYFVHGALCVAFSGNCYLSSLCFGESGNRGKCLQPCRMCYKCDLTKGYFFSAKDLCYAEKIKQLQEAGVDSVKIEGRLKRGGYVAQTVKSYKKLINFEANVLKEKNDLKKIFNRGEFNEGEYLFENNFGIINKNQNNNRGEKIGVVKSCKPFKNIYEIIFQSNAKINEGDGLKFVDLINNEINIGVGNVDEMLNNNFKIFSKNCVKINSKVFRTLNINYEKSLIPKKSKIPVEVEFCAMLGKKITIKLLAYGKETIFESDDITQQAKSMPLSKEEVIHNFNKIVDSEFEISQIKTQLDNVFIVKSKLNDLRKKAFEILENNILQDFESDLVKKNNYFNIDKNITNNKEFFGNYKIVNNIDQCKNLKDYFVIFSPEVFSFENVKNFYEQYKKLYTKKIIFLNLPIMATSKEIEIIDLILQNFTQSEIGVVANNLWGLKYINKYNLIAGFGLNIANKFAKNFYYNSGACFYFNSVENFVLNKSSGGNFCGCPTVMTLKHCPVKVIYDNDCNNCKFSKNIKYQLNDGKSFYLRRYKIINCYFELVWDKKIEANSNFIVCDER